MARIRVGDVFLNLEQAGEGTPLVLLHGLLETHLMWHAIAPLLARSFTVFAMKRPVASPRSSTRPEQYVVRRLANPCHG